jgi:hypothetical protein
VYWRLGLVVCCSLSLYLYCVFSIWCASPIYLLFYSVSDAFHNLHVTTNKKLSLRSLPLSETSCDILAYLRLRVTELLSIHELANYIDQPLPTHAKICISSAQFKLFLSQSDEFNDPLLEHDIETPVLSNLSPPAFSPDRSRPLAIFPTLFDIEASTNDNQHRFYPLVTVVNYATRPHGVTHLHFQ